MTKLETLTVPVDLGEWLQSRRIGGSGAYFSTIDALYHYWESVISSPTGSFITDNKKELIEVILGTRGYRVDKPLYYALIKGHELLEDKAVKYWATSDYDSGGVFLFYQYPDEYINTIVKNTKDKWNELGINDSNADLVKVDD